MRGRTVLSEVTLMRKDLSIYFFATFGSTSLDTMNRRKNSYTSCR